jgi:hypothetical protein
MEMEVKLADARKTSGISKTERTKAQLGMPRPQTLAEIDHDKELTCIPLSFADRTGHLPNLLADLIHRLRLPQTEKANISIPARQHGDLRRQQGYTVAMVVEESRILQVSIFSTLQNNLERVDFSKVLGDVITIADEVDSQLKQAVLSYVDAGAGPAPAWSAA